MRIRQRGGSEESNQEGEIIFLDKEGRWYHNGEEITHKRTIELFSASVVKDPDGGYMLRVGNECAKILVEDTPYMVRAVWFCDERVMIQLNDGSVEELDLGSLFIGRENVLYCRVKNGEYPARFLRPAYYQIMSVLVEEKGEFFLKVGTKLYKLVRCEFQGG